jgi:formate-dependent nitrite reductase cytochrome c552 subunit
MREVREARKRESAERAARAKLVREREKSLADAEAEVVRLEGLQRKLSTEIENPENHGNAALATKLNRELRDVQHKIAEATARWDLLAAEHSLEEPAST